MSLHREELQSLSRAFAARGQPPGQHSCPAPEQLFEAASGNLDVEQRMQIIDHVSGCAECAEAWRIAMELGVRSEEGSAQSGTAQRSRTRSSAWKFAIAASLFIVISVPYFATRKADDRSLYRNVTNSQAPTSLVADRLPRDRFLLRWSPAAAGSTYTLRLSTESLELLLAQPDLDTSELLVPSDVLETVRSNERLLWQVDARLSDGRRISSETFVVTLD